MTQDNLLSQFSRGFKGPRDETGLLDAGPPKAWVDAWYKLQRKEGKETAYQNIPGMSATLGKDENGNLTLQSTSGYTTFTPEQWTAFLRVAMGLQAGADPVTTAGYGGVSSAPDNPIQRQRMEQNLKAMEQWAKASSKSFPNTK